LIEIRTEPAQLTPDLRLAAAPSEPVSFVNVPVVLIALAATLAWEPRARTLGIGWCAAGGRKCR
jgi:hypothetical protein